MKNKNDDIQETGKCNENGLRDMYAVQCVGLASKANPRFQESEKGFQKRKKRMRGKPTADEPCASLSPSFMKNAFRTSDNIFQQFSRASVCRGIRKRRKEKEKS